MKRAGLAVLMLVVGFLGAWEAMSRSWLPRIPQRDDFVFRIADYPPRPEIMVVCSRCGRLQPASGEMSFASGRGREPSDTEIGVIWSGTWDGCFYCLVDTIEAGARITSRVAWKKAAK